MKHKYTITAWLVSIILFLLPGSSLPSTSWMQLIYLDKLIHIGIFALLFLIWSYNDKSSSNSVIWMTLVIYGILVELLQENLIRNRSFELMDWMADITGASLGWILINVKKPLWKQRP